MIFSESWLHTDVPDHNVSTEGFHTVWADRDCTKSGKRKGGGLALYVVTTGGDWDAGGTPPPHLLSSSPFTPQTSATRQSLAIFRNFMMTLLSLDVSASVRRPNTGCGGQLWPFPYGNALQCKCTCFATTTTADYCLCSCFLQLTCLVVECELQQQFNLIIGPHKRFWSPSTSHFHLLATVCIQCTSFMRMLILLCFW